MKASVWSLEWRLALRRRRLFVLNLAIPLLLVAPIALSQAPTFHAAAAYAVLFVIFGIFGSAIPLLREGEGGLLRRILLSGCPEARLLLEKLGAASALDCLQLLPALALILITGGATPAVWALAIAILVPTLLAANFLGAWVAATARSLAEGALFAAVVALFLLHGSGVFRTPVEGELSGQVERLLPFGPLHRVLLAGAEGSEPMRDVTGELLQPVAAASALILITWLAAPYLMARIAPAVRR